MKKVLLIKLTSLGDLIHALPALSDARSAYPDIRFDWVIDANFQEVARWHPAVDRVFTTNHRAWRQALKELKTYRSIYRLIQTLRQQDYDLVIDGQGNFKSAFLALCLKGEKAGYDRRSVREAIASFAYNRTFSVSKKEHAVQRMRSLFAGALDYPLPLSPPDFGIERSKFVRPQCVVPDNFLIFVHSGGWKSKLWPEEHWQALIRSCLDRGLHILLPWGNREEEERAKRLAISEMVTVLPKLSLSELGYLIERAHACVCVDTGLSHLTAALHVPSITLYGATDAGLIGAKGKCQEHLQASLSCSPCHKKRCPLSPHSEAAACLASLTPQTVFSLLRKILG